MCNICVCVFFSSVLCALICLCVDACSVSKCVTLSLSVCVECVTTVLKEPGMGHIKSIYHLIMHVLEQQVASDSSTKLIYIYIYIYIWEHVPKLHNCIFTKFSLQLLFLIPGLAAGRIQGLIPRPATSLERDRVPSARSWKMASHCNHSAARRRYDVSPALQGENKKTCASGGWMIPCCWWSAGLVFHCGWLWLNESVRLKGITRKSAHLINN